MPAKRRQRLSREVRKEITKRQKEIKKISKEEKKTPLYFYNTLGRKKQIFKTIKKGIVGYYTCGPTVYDYAHIGNLRTYIFEDILKRVLEYNRYEVKHVMNITDVDDKTIRRSQEEGITLQDLTEKYEKIFLDDLDKLNIIRASVISRATQHIPEMIAIAKSLINKGYAYKAEDGIYFSISKFKGYGKLANLKFSNQSKSRIKNDNYDKEEARDFAIWKFYNEKDGKVYWDSEIGKGRPGWHIECSAMSMKYLGDRIDIHAGAIDLIFPHHSNEIAQSEAASGKKFVKYWIHGGFLVMPEGKMSKSLGNIIKLKDIEERGYDSLAYRYFCLTAHYRSEIIFSEENLTSAQNAYRGLKNKVQDIKRNLEIAGMRSEKMRESKEEFLKLINDDLDMPKALSFFHNMLKSQELNNSEKYALILDFDKVFGLNLDKEERVDVPKDVKDMAEQRETARKLKQWQLADELRDKIKEKGYSVDDTSKGYLIKKL
ncbi:MAG: cysteine--tRNA ligase [archaeon]